MNHLGVFAKYWQPGRVKTRLAASIGIEKAAALYRQFVWATATRLACCGDHRSLWIAPPERADEFRHFCSLDWTVELQSDGDLGNRMKHFFDQVGSRYQRSRKEKQQIVLIGTDSPTLPTSYITEAFAGLQQNDCVIGPSCDGGYYLIGMSRPIPELFDDIPWSSEAVLPKTLDRVTELGISYQLLPKWNDIDELPDLLQLRDRLSKELDQTKRNTLDDVESKQQLLTAINLALSQVALNPTATPPGDATRNSESI